MAIWRLRAPHYLNIPGTKYIRQETDLQTGEAVYHTFDVPRLLDPEDKKRSANSEDGGCLVTNKAADKRLNKRLWLFVGSPTPDMEPEDEEAEAISASLRPQWTMPLDGDLTIDPTVTMAAAIGRALADQLSTLQMGGVARPQGGDEGMAALMAKVEALTNEVMRLKSGEAVAVVEDLRPEDQPIPETDDEPELALSEADDGALSPEELASVGLKEQPSVLSAADIAAMQKQPAPAAAGRRR